MKTENTLEFMMDAARAAGTVTLRYFRHGAAVSDQANIQEKTPGNPLTQADLETDRLLKKRLLAACPDCGWLSEETVDTPERLSKERVWVVDPIDGTKEFIIGLPQFSISIALVEQGLPMAACIYNPATEELFHAERGGGAFLNGEAIHTTQRHQLQGASCLASRTETAKGRWAPFAHEFSVRAVGSIAYKLALVAAGRFDFTFTLTPKSEWDICAGDLLVREAGGRISDKEGRAFHYNREKPAVRSLVASCTPLHDLILTRLAPVPLNPDRHSVELLNPST